MKVASAVKQRVEPYLGVGGNVSAGRQLLVVFQEVTESRETTAVNSSVTVSAELQLTQEAEKHDALAVVTCCSWTPSPRAAS